MTGQAHFLDALLMVGGGAVIAIYVWLAARSRSLLLRERMHFICPVSGLRVGATVTEDLSSGQLTDVKRCSGWHPFWQPCAKGCLAPLNDGRLQEETPLMLKPRPKSPA